MIFKPSTRVNAGKKKKKEGLIKKLESSICQKSLDEIGYINLKHNGLLHKYTLRFYVMKQTKSFKRILKKNLSFETSQS